MFKRDILILCICFLAAIALCLGIFREETLETGSWGLSFRTPGQAPLGPANSQTLQKYDAAYMGDPTEKVLYLTFDAGYENGCTAQILDALKKHKAPAVFFLVGDYLERNPDLVRRMVQEGHTVGNHTMDHPNMSKIDNSDSFFRQLQGVEALYTQITGRELSKIYRPPQGIYSEKNLEMAKALGYKTVFWSLAYVDWNNDAQPTREQAFAKLLPRTHNGAVVLLHSTSRTNAEILDELLTKWEDQGYRFGNIQELFG